MDSWVLVGIGMRAVAANRARSFLTMLGIIIGIASIITLLAIGTGAKNRLLEQMSTMGSNVILIVPGSTTSGGSQLGPGAVPTLTSDDARAMRTECPSVEMVAPNVRGGAQVVFGNQNWSTTITGVTPEFLTIREWPLLQGRYFMKRDNTGAMKTCIIGQTIADKLFGGMDPISQIVRIKNMPFTVVGLLDKKGQSAQGTDQDDVVFIPLRTAQRRLFGGPFPEAVHAVLARARDASSLTSAQEEITALLKQRHHITGSQSNDFTVKSLTEIVSAAARSAGTMSVLLGAIASISLVVGGIGIMNIMLVSVTERTREIGIRIAVGAKRRDILLQFLLEAMLLTTVGGILGVALGVGSSMVSKAFLGWSPVITVESVVVAVLFSAMVGIFFGLYPAQRAAKLNPIDALRSE